ncbi:MAG: HAD-IC family P-type ATPase, partial [Gemmatimonadota bacterium]
MLVGVAEGAEDHPEVRGVLALADRTRSQAAGAFRALHEAGIERVVMLTGDNEATARSVARELGQPGVDEIRAGLLPKDKVAAIREFQEHGALVLMVGDGVNDSP